jgi:nitrogen fixation protein FixH
VLSRTADGRVIAELRDSAGKPLSGAKVTATAEHPLGRRPETELAFRERAWHVCRRAGTGALAAAAGGDGGGP